MGIGLAECLPVRPGLPRPPPGLGHPLDLRPGPGRPPGQPGLWRQHLQQEERRPGPPPRHTVFSPEELGVLPARVRGSSRVLIAQLEEVTWVFTAKPWRPRGLGGQGSPRVPAASACSPPLQDFSQPRPAPNPSHTPASRFGRSSPWPPGGGGDPGVRAPVLGEWPEAGP